MYFSFKNNFFLRETRDGLGAFSGADLSRARFLTRSSKTLDREHRWNNAGFEKARVEWRKNRKGEATPAKNSESREAGDRRVVGGLLIDPGP